MKRFLLICGALLAVAPLRAQVQPVAIPQFQFLSDDGTPLAGGKVCTYSGGTTSPLATFTDSTGTVQNADPTILNSAGRASIWFGAQSYKMVVRTAGSDGTCATGSIIWSQDNIPGAGQAVTSNAFSAITAATNSNAGTFAMSGNTLDLSAATAFKTPVGAGAVPTTSGLMAYDSTANKFVFGVNGATKSFGLASTGACSAGQFVSSPATATAIAGCSAPSLTGSTCSGCTINGSSTITSTALTGVTVGSSTWSNGTLSGTIAGSPTLSGALTFSGTVASSEGVAGNILMSSPDSGATAHTMRLVWDVDGSLNLVVDGLRIGYVCISTHVGC